MHLSSAWGLSCYCFWDWPSPAPVWISLLVLVFCVVLWAHCFPGCGKGEETKKITFLQMDETDTWHPQSYKILGYLLVTMASLSGHDCVVV